MDHNEPECKITEDEDHDEYKVIKYIKKMEKEIKQLKELVQHKDNLLKEKHTQNEIYEMQMQEQQNEITKLKQYISQYENHSMRQELELFRINKLLRQKIAKYEASLLMSRINQRVILSDNSQSTEIQHINQS